MQGSSEVGGAHRGGVNGAQHSYPGVSGSMSSRAVQSFTLVVNSGGSWTERRGCHGQGRGGGGANP